MAPEPELYVVALLAKQAPNQNNKQVNKPNPEFSIQIS
jgi:hypothetical protein